jgi:hypothetical protein
LEGGQSKSYKPFILYDMARSQFMVLSATLARSIENPQSVRRTLLLDLRTVVGLLKFLKRTSATEGFAKVSNENFGFALPLALLAYMARSNISR